MDARRRTGFSARRQVRGQLSRLLPWCSRKVSMVYGLVSVVWSGYSTVKVQRKAGLNPRRAFSDIHAAETGSMNRARRGM